MKKDDQEILVSASDIKVGDEVVVRMGKVIPFDGVVTGGEAMVNQASLTGESVPVRRVEHNSVYAGTVIGYKKIIPLFKENVKEIRIVLNDYRVLPQISFVGVYPRKK